MKNEFRDFQLKAKKLLTEFAEEVANDGLNFFVSSFTNQGFTNRSLQKWQPRKINQLYLKRATKNAQPKKNKKGYSNLILTTQAKRTDKAILVQRGKLRRSMRKQVSGLTVTWSNSQPYAQIHNEGGMAGRGKKVKIPQRQYMGESEVLMDQFTNTFLNMMDKAFNS